MHYKKENKLEKTLSISGSVSLQVLKILFSSVFLFSGFVKAVDPLGFKYKLLDYFEAFGWSWSLTENLSLGAAVFLIVLEMLIGALLMFQIQFRRVAILSWIYMFVMTLLTWYIVQNNPVSDCGCFGDALILTNTQTFIKNIVLLVIISLLWIFSSRFKNIFLPAAELILGVLLIVLFTFFSGYSIRHLPVLDFRPYTVGTYIPDKMFVPEDAEVDEYQTTFIYEKEGVQKEFTLQNYPANDSSWVFIDQRSILIKRGYVPEIHDFVLIDKAYEDVTADILDYYGYTYLLVVNELDKADVNGLEIALNFLKKYHQTNVHVYLLTSSSDEAVESFQKKYGVHLNFLKADPITLKTIIRANPGLVKLKQGKILGKWNWRDIE